MFANMLHMFIAVYFSSTFRIRQWPLFSSNDGCSHAHFCSASSL